MNRVSRIWSYEEIIIYENKKVLNYWLEAKNLEHPPTNVFYHKKEALELLMSRAIINFINLPNGEELQVNEKKSYK